VFGGVMAGISFFLLNNVFGYRQPAELVALADGGGAGPDLQRAVAAAFGWLVLRR
jgi:lipopolysaccharide export system permease protein